MAINRVQFQRGLAMAEFMERYGTQELCHAALVASRWPNGFVCAQWKALPFVSPSLSSCPVDSNEINSLARFLRAYGTTFCVCPPVVEQA